MALVSSKPPLRTNNFGRTNTSVAAKPPTQDTYIKLRLAAEPSAPETWFKMQKKEGFLEFISTSKQVEYVARLYDHQSAIKIFTPSASGELQIGECQCLRRKDSLRDNPKYFLTGYLNTEGIGPGNGALKIVGNMVGAESLPLAQSMYDQGLKVWKAKQNMEASTPLVVQAAGQTMEFGF